MSIEQTMRGNWCLLVEEEPYHAEGRTLLRFRDGLLMDGDGTISPYVVAGNTLNTSLGDGVALTINPGDAETSTPASDLAIEEDRVKAIVTSSFEVGSDDLVEYATLVRQVDE